jgi:hypothetical protein
MPPHIGLSGEKAESGIGLNEESVADFGRRCGGVIDGLCVEIPVRGGTESIAAFCQRLSALFRLASRRRCFSSQ